jgi:hypothetical protein
MWKFIVALLIATFVAFSSTATPIKHIHVVFMNHLDVGFTDFALGVVNLYFDKYYPLAIDTANRMRKTSVGYVYTTHPWLVSLYLDCPSHIWKGLHCPNDTSVSHFKEAVKRGDIAWHALPFNGQSEIMDSNLFEWKVLFLILAVSL